MIRIDDYQASLSRDPRDGSEGPIDLPKSNVLIYTTQDGTRLAARPSGTEPKIKFYLFGRSDVSDEDHLPIVKKEAAAVMQALFTAIDADARKRAES